MSQRGPAPYQNPHNPPRTSAGEQGASPTTTRRALPSYGGESRHDSGTVAYTNGAYRAQHIPPRTLGVHNILNPSGARPMGSEADESPPARFRETEPSLPGVLPTGHGQSRPLYPHHQASASHPGTPIGSMTVGGGSNSGRNSPASQYPFPALNNTRTILSPKPPRAASISQSIVTRDLDPRQQQIMPVSSPAKRPYEPEASDESRGHFSSLHRPLRLSTPPRSVSQPLSRHYAAPPGPQTPISGRDHQSQPQSMQMTQAHQGVPSSRPFQTTGESSSVSAWAEMMRRSGAGSSMGGVEGQQAYMTLPGSDIPIPVQVDYSQASKKADEKRQRNAKASTRHRRKKKTMQEENMRQLQTLKDERQQMIQHIEELTHQRDFYRGERHRLRDIVSRNPTTSELAAGPPSPPPLRPLGPFSDKSPMSQHQRPTTSQGYTSESSMGERPTQRRRTDERPHFSMPVYGTPTIASATALPPMQGQFFGGPPRPPSATSSGSAAERLPPLRVMESSHVGHGPGHGPAPAQGQAQEQDPRTGQWVPLQPRQYETGWATAPRLPHEPSRQ
ncbi:hypothetical protein S7711_08854 [Stachybotrys chartarum IBT 7711]|uniref:BZIP domain-containing protein n=1 Tax=Stachybotrys chartarum (strain CBS 109288 / IBT 7711) TaxID=1280523 RepID=A0A084AHR8_STACB|nr:hypothetical protein S7711_08854 [Stachybotrys chartarum IBT 7711]KFA55782.1 hypothetical protein S40293_01895 [Stachybotrys chartarum IBT 40293]